MRSAWTPQRDYALAFGTGLGMSASQIARSMGDVTRNAVIGRWHRLGMSACDRPARPRKTIPALERSPPPRVWTEAEDAEIRGGFGLGESDNTIATRLPGRSYGAVYMRRLQLGLKKLSLRRFSEEEDAIIRGDYLAHVDVGITALKINRTFGAVRQRILALGLTRDARKTRLAAKFGAEALQLSDDPAEIARIMQRREAGARAQREAEHQARVGKTLDIMDAALAAGEDRKAAFQAAMLAGCTLQQIGDRVGVTRERVRQVSEGLKPTRKPAPPRRLNCQSCGSHFDGHGSRKYCDAPECIEARQETRRQYAREYQERHRQELRVYKRHWTRRSRMKEKLLAMETSDLAEMLVDLSRQIGAKQPVDN